VARTREPGRCGPNPRELPRHPAVSRSCSGQAVGRRTRALNVDNCRQRSARQRITGRHRRCSARAGDTPTMCEPHARSSALICGNVRSRVLRGRLQAVRESGRWPASPRLAGHHASGARDP
jgi:hypothetical protein